MRSTALVLALAALECVLPAVLWAHSGPAPGPRDLWRAWGLEPGVLLSIAAAALIYFRGLRALWTRAGRARGVTRNQAWAYAAGLLTLVIALVSPLDGVSASLFAAHMVQHVLLILVAAPLLAIGAPVLVWLWALPPSARGAVQRGWHIIPGLRATSSILGHPLVAWVLHAAAVWSWHLPSLYDLAVRNDAAHALEHLCFLSTGVLFWWVVLPRGGALRNAHGTAMLYVFTFALQMGLLGALLTLSGRPWYPAHATTTYQWGLTPLEDQQLAGVIMWVPGSLVYILALSALFLLWMRAAERRVLDREAVETTPVGQRRDG